MDRADRDAEQNCRERQQQRLHDEELQRRENLAGRDDAERRQQEQRAGQRIQGGNDGKDELLIVCLLDLR